MPEMETRFGDGDIILQLWGKGKEMQSVRPGRAPCSRFAESMGASQGCPLLKVSVVLGTDS
jgi:hypothetical protein